MRQPLRLATDPLDQFLRDYLDYLQQSRKTRAAQISVTAYVANDSRIKPIMVATQHNSQYQTTYTQDTWATPKDHLRKSIQSGNIETSADNRAVCIPIFPASNLTTKPIGLLAVKSTASTTKNGSAPDHFNPQGQLLERGQSALETLRLQVTVNWQTHILNTFDRICTLDYASYSLARLYEELITAALSIAPGACIGHLITVESDPVTGEPVSLTLEYAQESKKNKPTVTPEILELVPENHPLRHYSINEGVTGLCAKERVPKRFNNIDRLLRYKVFHQGTQSEACFPLVIGEQVIGVLNLESEWQNAFTDTDMDNLRILADEIALVISVVSGIQTRIKLYDKGLLTLQKIFDSLSSPETLIAEVLSWARDIGTPPYEYASFTPSESAASLSFTQSGHKPSEQDEREMIPISLDHQGEYVGTLTLSTSSTHILVKNHATKTLGSFAPVLAAVIHTGLAVFSTKLELETSNWLASAIRHTIAEVSDLVNRPLLPSSDTGKVNVVTGALDFMHLDCEIISGELLHAEQSSVTDIAAAVRDVERVMTWQFTSSGISLTAHYPPKDRVLLIKGQPSTLKWALVELLFNALKYSRAQGGNHVFVTVRHIQGSKTVDIEVEDECIVIPEDERTEVWKLGVRGKSANVSTVRGTGLGLYIVERCCYKLGVKCRIEESKKLRGNKFVLQVTIEN